MTSPSACTGRKAKNPWRQTRWNVFAEMEGKVGHRWYLWVTRSPSVVFFHIAPSRGAAVPKTHFAKLHKDLVEVVLVCDRYSAYKSLAKDHDDMLLAYCWAHVRRDFLNAARSWPELAPWMWQWIEDIRTLYRLNTARLAVWEATVPLDAQAPAFVARQHDLTTHLGEMQDRCAMYRQERHLHEAKRPILESLHNHWGGLTVFLTRPEVALGRVDDWRGNSSEILCYTPVWTHGSHEGVATRAAPRYGRARLMRYTFATYVLDTQRHELRQQGVPVPLERKAYQVLVYLVQQADRLVTKRELLEAVWPAVYVDDSAVARCIGAVRQAVGDGRATQRVIRTVHGQGYRFVAPVVVHDGDAMSTALVAPTPPEPTGAAAPVPLALPGASPCPWWGRAAEVAQLQACFAQAQHGSRQLVFVTGEAGIGNKTVVDAFLAQVEAAPPVWLGHGQCIEQYGAGEAYLPLLDALGRLGRGAERARLVALLRR